MDDFERLRAICLVLPEAVEAGFGDHEDHPTFRVRNKVFTWYSGGPEGRPERAAWVKAAPGVQQELVASDPDRFFVPPYLGPRGWVGVRLQVPDVDWTEVAELVLDSYRLVAPKRLAMQLDRFGFSPSPIDP